MYTESADGKIAIVLDFSSVYRSTPSYDYYDVIKDESDIMLFLVFDL